MQAIRIHKPSTPDAEPFSSTNPAPSSALFHDHDVPIPKPQATGEFLVRIHATTVTRDELTWPETYGPAFPILGHDLAGVIVSAYDSGFGPEDRGVAEDFRPGIEVFGVLTLHVGTTWAEYAVGKTSELAVKPKSLSWAEAASVALSGLTAWQALFEKAGIQKPDFSNLSESTGNNKNTLIAKGKTLLVTGAAGAVGMYIVQIAALVGFHVVAASSSNPRNGEFLKGLGAAEVVEYGHLDQQQPDSFDLIVDTVGGEPLEKSWRVVAPHGTIITVDSSSSDFAQRGRPAGKEDVKAVFFIVEPSGAQLSSLALALELGFLKTFVSETLPLAEAREAYERASGHSTRRGKVVLTL